MKKIFLTVDTECHDINNQDRYLWGKTCSGKEYGLKLYLELGKELGIPINFFVDVAECKRYGIDFVKRVVDLIKSYNQPVYFHLHPNFITGDDKRSFLWQYTKLEQKSILEEGLAYYKEVTGLEKCLAFRAGRYGSDSGFYDVLSSVLGEGVLDLSYTYENEKMCHLTYSEIKTKNNIKSFKGCRIFPNTTYIALKLKRSYSLGLDTADTTFREFRRFLKKNQTRNVILTSHSWNFVKAFYFIKGRVWGNDNEVRKFKKMVALAKQEGYEFSRVQDVDMSLQDNLPDTMCDLCISTVDKLNSFLENFLRFQKIARLSPKYFRLYSFFYLLLFLTVICVLLYIC